jgi:uncharacterized LabA/DUF88 family protein
MNDNQRILRSALFVDFDNLFIRLSQQDEVLAETFATQPLQWLEWFEEKLDSAYCYSTPCQRRIICRRCYLNPKSFGKYRPYFIRAAFETVDCPTLTTYGKTSADVHMVLDILELLDHKVFYDEFIILSADADFTPVLLKLRKCDRRTAVLAVGNSSPAYQAASDMLVDQDKFIDEALLLNETFSEPQDGYSKAAAQENGVIHMASAIVKNLVEKSGTPVSMASLASKIRNEISSIDDTWHGHTTFKHFLASLSLNGLKISSVMPGYVYDPSRHTAPAPSQNQQQTAIFSENSDLSRIAIAINRITDTPLLSPRSYKRLFEIIADEVNSNGFHLVPTSKNVRDHCKEEEINISRQSVNFVLRGISFAGHRFVRENEVAENLARAFYKNTLNLCENAQLSFEDTDIPFIKEWIGVTHSV